MADCRFFHQKTITIVFLSFFPDFHELISWISRVDLYPRPFFLILLPPFVVLSAKKFRFSEKIVNRKWRFRWTISKIFIGKSEFPTIVTGFLAKSSIGIEIPMADPHDSNRPYSSKLSENTVDYGENMAKFLRIPWTMIMLQ